MTILSKVMLVSTVVGTIVGGMSPSATGVSQTITALQSPHGYGQLTSRVSWQSTKSFSLPSGVLKDLAADGHGPYLHIMGFSAGMNIGEFPKCSIHNTTGPGSSKSVTQCKGTYIEGGRLDKIHVWVCNGGDFNGVGAVEGGCHGREYWNQYTYPGKRSISLGNSPVLF